MENREKPLRGNKKVDVAISLSIISLIVSSLLAGYSIYLTNQANDLTEQANRIAEKSLDLQNMQINYSTAIITNPNQIVVLDVDGHVHNETDAPTSCLGWLNGSVTVISPYYGTISIHVINFTVGDDYSSLIPEKNNLTKVYPVYGYNQKYENLPVVSGLNLPFDFAFQLDSVMFPNSQIFVLPNEDKVIPIGFLLLEARLDTLTGLSFPKYFHAQVYAVVRNY